MTKQEAAFSPDDLIAWRRRLGLSTLEAGAALGVTDRAIRMWESGERPISRMLALACAAVQAKLEPFGGVAPD